MSFKASGTDAALDKPPSSELCTAPAVAQGRNPAVPHSFQSAPVSETPFKQNGAERAGTGAVLFPQPEKPSAAAQTQTLEAVAEGEVSLPTRYARETFKIITHAEATEILLMIKDKTRELSEEAARNRDLGYVRTAEHHLTRRYNLLRLYEKIDGKCLYTGREL